MSVVTKNTRRIIHEKGYKQAAIANRAGVSPKVFSDMLTGRRIVRADFIPNLAKALGVEPNELFREG